MKGEKFRIHIRQALLCYLLKRLGLTPDRITASHWSGISCCSITRRSRRNLLGLFGFDRLANCD